MLFGDFVGSNSVILGTVTASTQYVMTKPAPVVLPQYQHNDMDIAGAAVCSPRPTCNLHDHGVLCGYWWACARGRQL